MPTLEEVTTMSTAGGRVCPMPQQWNELWAMLPNRTRVGAGWHPPLPLILAAWWEKSDFEKRERLATHLRYAEENGCLNEIATFLARLPLEQWHVQGDGNA